MAKLPSDTPTVTELHARLQALEQKTIALNDLPQSDLIRLLSTKLQPNLTDFGLPQSILTDAVGDGQITQAKLAPGAAVPGAGTVTSAMITDGTIVMADLSAALQTLLGGIGGGAVVRGGGVTIGIPNGGNPASVTVGHGCGSMPSGVGITVTGGGMDVQLVNRSSTTLTFWNTGGAGGDIYWVAVV